MSVSIAKAWCHLWFQNSQVWIYLEEKGQNLLSFLSSFTCLSEVRFCSVARGSLVPTLWPKLAPHLQKFLSVSQVLGCQVWAPNPALSWLFSTVNPAPSKDTQQTVSFSGYLLFCSCLCLVLYITKRAKQAGVVPHTCNPKCWDRSIAVSSRSAWATQ